MGVRHTHATSSPPGAWAEPCQATSLSLDAAEGGVSSGDKLVGICIDAIGGGYTYTSLAMCLLRCVSCHRSLARVCFEWSRQRATARDRKRIRCSDVRAMHDALRAAIASCRRKQDTHETSPLPRHSEARHARASARCTARRLHMHRTRLSRCMRRLVVARDSCDRTRRAHNSDIPLEVHMRAGLRHAFPRSRRRTGGRGVPSARRSRATAGASATAPGPRRQSRQVERVRRMARAFGMRVERAYAGPKGPVYTNVYTHTLLAAPACIRLRRAAGCGMICTELAHRSHVSHVLLATRAAR